MAKITAKYQRTFQVKAYESETITLSVEEEVRVAGPDKLANAVAVLHDKLSEVGDEIMGERCRKPDPRAKSAATRPPPADDF